MLQSFFLIVNESMKKARKAKKTFVLLEILIAFALVSISILPFLRFPYATMKKELDLLFEMELQKKGQNCLVEMTQEFLEKKLPSSLFFDEEKQQEPVRHETITIQLGKGIERKFEEKVYVQFEKQKKGADQTLYSLGIIRIDYLPVGKKIGRKLRLETQVVAQKKI